MQILSIYPFVFEGKFYDSSKLCQNKTCIKKCKEKNCLKVNLEETNTISCSKGYDVVIKKFGDNKFIFNGLIFNSNDSVPKGRKEARRDWLVNEIEFDSHMTMLSQTMQYLENDINETIIKRLSMFHDFKSSLNVFYDCTQDIIHSLPGANFEDKLNNSETSYKNLYNALDLITSQLGMIDVVSNPKSIVFGAKKEINIYKLFDKIKYLFEHHRITRERNVEIEIETENHRYIRNSMCYESIEFIPLILLDNALKYSSPYSTVQIRLQDKNNSVKVAVKNIGPLVKDENMQKIFNKFYRGEHGEQHTRRGLGVGLWVAQSILKNHDSQLYYEKDNNANGDIGLNIFEFELTTI